jgi:NAD(P)-dependent dehydrogenase (short-subunit alcohol dehydrogenase family)
MGIEQKVAVITGASQGIGAALVKAYRDRNYRIVATARSIRPSNDDEILAVPGDIADRKTAERAISEGMARFGRGCVLGQRHEHSPALRLSQLRVRSRDRPRLPPRSAEPAPLSPYDSPPSPVIRRRLTRLDVSCNSAGGNRDERNGRGEALLNVPPRRVLSRRRAALSADGLCQGPAR